MKLRNMSAYVTEEPTITIELSGEVLKLENALVLHSYSSRVAVYCKRRVYLLPRYDYSITTWKHLHAFVQDHCSFVRDYPANVIRDIARYGAADSELEYAFASGIVTGVDPGHCKCEGCINWPCEGVCALTEHVETY